MSRGRNVLPFALATAFGILNGAWVFGPALKEQQEQKQAETRNVMRELEKEDSEITRLREADTTAPITSIAELSNIERKQDSSWWQSGSLSTKRTSHKSNVPAESQFKDTTDSQTTK